MSRRKPKPANLHEVRWYMNVKRNATMLASGRPVAPSERVTLRDDEWDDPHNKALIEDGVLLHIPAPKGEPPIDTEPPAEVATDTAEQADDEGAES